MLRAGLAQGLDSVLAHVVQLYPAIAGSGPRAFFPPNDIAGSGYPQGEEYGDGRPI